MKTHIHTIALFLRHARSFTLRLAVLIMISLTAQSLSAQSLRSQQWTLASPYGDGVHHTQNLRLFAEDVANATGQAIRIDIAAGGSLIEHSAIPRAVRTGRVAMGEVLMATMTASDPIYELDNLPFIASDFAAAEQLWAISKPLISNSLDQRDGMLLLFAVPWPPQGLYANIPLREPDELADLNMRTYSNTLKRLATLLNAGGVNIEAGDIPTAFAEGRIDSMITSAATGVSSRAWEFADYYYDVQAWIPKNMVMMNKRLFLSLPDEHRQAILAAAESAEQRGWQMARTEATNTTAALAEQGMTVQQPTPAITNHLRQVGATMAAEWVATSGASVEDVLLEYLNLARSQQQDDQADSPLDSRFIPRQHGTIVDTRTQLEWARCSVGQEWDGQTCAGSPRRLTYHGAEEYIEQLNTTEPLAGFTDWRVPTLAELRTLIWCVPLDSRLAVVEVEHCTGEFETPTIHRPAFPNTPASWFWSATVNPENDTETFGVYFRLGYEHPIWQHTYRHHVRMVRSR
ncbi:TRAP transporter substrate-binding protein DctP [Salinispirillum marinum]|uniref:TRAP transporter substrate-binding protein DctP n=2 Tax=Saccharospirillaceae TaxID=255527 RepID=A0ABV8BIT1_9GAMM